MLRSVKIHFHFQVMRSVDIFCINARGRLYVDSAIYEIKRKIIPRLASYMIMHYASKNNNTAIIWRRWYVGITVTSVAIIFDYFICLRNRAIYGKWSIFANSIPVPNCKGLTRHPTTLIFEIFLSFSPTARMTTVWLAARLNSEYVD